MLTSPKRPSGKALVQRDVDGEVGLDGGFERGVAVRPARRLLVEKAAAQARIRLVGNGRRRRTLGRAAGRASAAEEDDAEASDDDSLADL